MRHGQTKFNVEDRVQGMANSDLTDKGIADARALGRGLAQDGITFDRAYASDLTRAADTARLALDAAGQERLAITETVGLREENYGKYEGQLTNDFSQELFGLPNFTAALLAHQLTLAQIADATRATNEDQVPNRAEDNAMVQNRLDQTLRTIGQEALGEGDRRVLAVSHGTAILMWLNFIGFDTGGQEMLHNASVTRVVFDGTRFTVVDFDDLKWTK